MKVISLVGARPQFIKEAVLSSAVKEHGAWEHIVVHSGQHYDSNMSDIFFSELNITEPKYNMVIGSGSHGEVTARAIDLFEKILLEEKPDKVIVYGDTNTTLAGAIAAVKLKIPIAHIEAGLRQEPKDMPEEINRILTDRISRWLFCCSPVGVDNLAHEGITSNVHISGDIMYDLFLKLQKNFDKTLMKQLHLSEGRYIILTLHRDFNVDDVNNLSNIISGVSEYAAHSNIDVVFPLHPRTKFKMEQAGLKSLTSRWKVIEPIGYLQLMGMLEEAAFVVTDSGGLQKEAWFAGKRAAVIMPDTSWRELTDCGWNILVPADAKNFHEKLSTLSNRAEYPKEIYGCGDAAEKIVDVLRG